MDSVILLFNYLTKSKETRQQNVLVKEMVLLILLSFPVHKRLKVKTWVLFIYSEMGPGDRGCREQIQALWLENCPATKKNTADAANYIKRETVFSWHHRLEIWLSLLCSWFKSLFKKSWMQKVKSDSCKTLLNVTFNSAAQIWLYLVVVWALWEHINGLCSIPGVYVQHYTAVDCKFQLNQIRGVELITLAHDSIF